MQRYHYFLSLVLGTCLLTTACSTKRQIAVDYPANKTITLAPVKGYDVIDGDDYYVQLISDFVLQGGGSLKEACSELSSGYESGNLSAALVFTVRNEALKLNRDVGGFLYEATTGQCNFKMDTKKALLTPWMRLDTAKDTSVDYHFLTSTSREANFDKLMGHLGTASNLLALTGVGTGVAIMGNLAGQWVAARNAQVINTNIPAPAPETKSSDETHTLPPLIELNDKSVTLSKSSLTVNEVVDSGTGIGNPEPKVLGQLNIYPAFTTSLLLKVGTNGAPDARELTLAELWQAPIKTATGDISLQQLLSQIKTNDQSYLTPDWKNYAHVQNSCQQLKRNLKALGFNKFDRNAVLFYFLQQAPDWRNYHTPLQHVSPNGADINQLRNYQSKNFAECLNSADLHAMRMLGLAVNQEQDWQQIFNARQQQDNLYSQLASVARQFLLIIKNPNTGEIAQQLYPLLASAKNGEGTVLLQNHLGNFGLEGMLQMANLANAGEVVSAEQLSKALGLLAFDKVSCVRPAPEQGKLLPNVGILLFTGKPNSPRASGGALEFAINAGKIVRITLQLPSVRDFDQHLLEQPNFGGCQVDVKAFAP